MSENEERAFDDSDSHLSFKRWYDADGRLHVILRASGEAAEILSPSLDDLMSRLEEVPHDV